MYQTIKKELIALGDPDKVDHDIRFFKTGKGEYGEGDKFISVKVPVIRSLAKKYTDIDVKEIIKLLHDPIHEVRFMALVILCNKYKKTKDDADKKIIFDLYLKNIKFINNWDLVDLSAHKIIGAYLSNQKDRDILIKLAKTDHLWSQRIAVMSTFAFIRQNDFDMTLKLAEMLLDHPHDLMHKIIGWMLREIGKRDQPAEEVFLKKYYKKMPRTMLRYAIEKFPEKLRKAYLKGTV